MSENSSNFCTECQRPTIDIDAHRDIFHVNWGEILQNDPWPGTIIHSESNLQTFFASKVSFLT